MKTQTASGRLVETSISGRDFKAFNGAKKHSYSSKVTNLADALKKCGLRDGMCLSFHHQLRNGDFVINKTLETVRELGVKNIMMAQTAMFNVHEPVIDFICDNPEIKNYQLDQGMTIKIECSPVKKIAFRTSGSGNGTELPRTYQTRSH